MVFVPYRSEEPIKRVGGGICMCDDDTWEGIHQRLGASSTGTRRMVGMLRRAAEMARRMGDERSEGGRGRWEWCKAEQHGFYIHMYSHTTLLLTS